MRVGLVVYDGLDQTSGGYLYDRQIIAGVRARGHAVRTVAIPRRRYTRNLLDNVSPTVWSHLSELADWADVLLEDELCHPSLIGPNRRLAGEHPTLPIVSVVHHLRGSERWPPLDAAAYRRVERTYLNTVDAFVYNSRATRRTVESAIGETTGVLAPPGRDHLEPEIDRGDIRSRVRAQDSIRLLFVGSVVERKNLETLLSGLWALESDWSLTVVGDTTADPAYVERVQRHADRLGVTTRVTWTGRVSASRLDELYRGHDLLAVPSRHEGYGIVYLEAMGYGLPAIGTRAGGASELIEDGTTGRVVDPDDSDAVREAVTELAGDRDRLLTRSLAARAAFEGHHTWDEVAGSVTAFLTEIVTAAPSARQA